MRVLKVSNSYYPFMEMGGPSIKVRGIAERLVQRGHIVTVLTVNRGRPGGTLSHDIGGVLVVYLRSLMRYRAVTFNPGLVSYCMRAIRDFDVAHIYGLYDLLGVVVAMFCRRRHIPYVLEPLGMHRPVLRSVRAKRLYHRVLGHALIDGAARVVATSDQERNWLVEDGLREDRIVLRHNGIDLTEFANLPPQGSFRKKWEIKSEEKLTLFLGRLAPIKSLDLLIEAFAGHLSNTGRLVITGPEESDGYGDYLKDLAERRGLTGRVLFTGPLFGRDKLEALVDADVLVLPSHSESFGNAPAEAIACGTPVIVTEGCGIAPLVRDRVGLVVPHDAQSLGESIQRVFSDSGLREGFRRHAPVVARQLSWDGPVAEMEEIYEQVVATSRAGVAATT